MTLFDAKTVELKGLNLIEASAGTGKTYTLAELYCRLVVEKQLEVKQILVVTYTRAATEELRGRLRKKLVEQRQRLSKEPEPDSKAIKRLKLAIQSFDEAAIFTIHGFCQRALQDFAFESGYSFDMEMITDEEELKEAVVDDFWRRYISTADPDFARFLLNKKQTPETLLSAVGGLPGKPYLNYIPVLEVDSAHLQEQIETAFAQLKQLWSREAEQVSAFVRDTSNMKQNSYKLEKVEQWLIQLDELVTEEKAPIGLFKDFYRFTFNEIKTKGLKKNVELPQLLFWSVCETLYESDSALHQSFEIALQRLRMQLADYLKQELPKRKQQLKLQAFDDLLLNLQHALHAQQGNRLAAQIRQQFQAALIDEFQDTDPVQYDCFKTIFADSDNPVFFVGDPKQAIYSFRGADIFTYLKAKQASQREFNLDTNWRSHPSLVKAVNTLFEQVEKPFIYDDIPFLPVLAARPDHAVLEVNKQPVSPLEFAWIEPDNDKAMTVAEMQNRAANMTATQIAELMQHAANGKATLTEEGGSSRALNGGDIAVLVRNHIQATAIQQALRQRGINSVQQSRENVFQSEQAVMLEHVLLAIAQPGNDSLIATALATPLFAKSALQIYLLQQDDMQWLQQSDFFQLLHETWRQSGFIVMFRFLLEQLDVQRRLLQQADGERQLTNLMHLAELVQAYARRRNSTMEAILTWLAAQRQASASATDTAQIRLESDEQLVKVITIHTSKGLEYPLVFCPFLWHQRSSNNKPDLRIFHRGDSHEAYVAFGEPGLSEAQPIAEQEAKAEELRLLYVALTRARERCVILWGPASNCENTALFSLLHQQLNKTDATQMYADLSALAQQSPQYISLQQAVSQDVQSAYAVNTAVELAARQFKGNIITPWQVGSFSGLSRGHSVEQPDYDADTSSTDWLQTQEKRRDRFGFPRGANAGICLHSLFENWSFEPTASDWPQLIHKTLKQYGIDDDWSDVVDSWLVDVVKTPLDKNNELKLEAITTDKRLDEMAFYFPVNHLTVKRLKTTLKPFYIEMPVLEKVLAQLSFNDLTGFMKGFIDLVFEFEGRFYIADYKSNWLGERPEDYNTESLNEAMVQHGYPLQYLIYSLALHRYLKIRMPDYDPEQHFGGIYYLFIRGMQPEWGQAGVYFDKPSSALLEALDNCMQEVGDD
jgi:exodeoxyribonuclease V beta subunit